MNAARAGERTHAGVGATYAGANPRRLDARGGEAGVRRLPHARLVMVPGAGHFVNLERPDVVNREVLARIQAELPRLPTAAMRDGTAGRILAAGLITAGAGPVEQVRALVRAHVRTHAEYPLLATVANTDFELSPEEIADVHAELALRMLTGKSSR